MSSIRGNQSRLGSPLTWDSLPEEQVDGGGGGGGENGKGRVHTHVQCS